MWALVHFREQAERFRVKRIRADEKVAKEAAKQRKREGRALAKEGGSP